MKCSEVRVGSIVEVSGKPYVIDSDDIVKLQWGNVLEERRYKPMMLTEELLVKAGFERIQSVFYRYNGNFLIEVLFYGNENSGCNVTSSSVVIKEANQLHKFQDLCRLMLNVELKFV